MITTKKLVTIGDAQVGKSSLLYRLTHKKTPNINEATIGAAFYCTNIKSCRLNMWDTAGQERFRSMVPVYLRDSDIIFFVYDVADLKSFEHLRDYWIDFALTHSIKEGDSHSRSHSRRSVSQSLPQLPKKLVSSTVSSVPIEKCNDNVNPFMVRRHYQKNIEMQESLPKIQEQLMSVQPKSVTKEEDQPFCIIIANKCDLTETVVPNSLGIELAKRIGACFIEASAKTGANTERLLELINQKLEEKKTCENHDSESKAFVDHNVVILNDGRNMISELLSPNNCNC